MPWPWQIPLKLAPLTPEKAPAGTLGADAELIRLYDEHAPAMMRFALLSTRNREAAQEAMQEAFIALLGRLRCGGSVERPRELLYQALCESIQLRSASTDQPALDPDAPLWDQPDFDAPLRAAEVRRRINRIASPRELVMLRLRAEGLSYQEIANALEITAGTVASTLARAFRKVRKAFEGDLP